MFQGLPWHFDIIFFLEASPKCDFNEVDKAMFKWLLGTEDSFSASLPAQNAI